jgi:hypothetical protein
MNEDFLHYIWKFQLFNHHQLLTTEGDKLEIVKAGLHNLDSGPDFFNGQLILDQTRWAGNIEIHIRSSDWFKHGHQKDEVYDKVILHVVWEKDRKVHRDNGEEIPCIELKGRVKRSILEKYQELSSQKAWIPCESDIQGVEASVVHHQLDRVLVERLEVKSNRVDQILELSINDWEQTLYQLLCKYLGFKVNAAPFELLATSLPLSILRKHQSNLVQLEALLLGQAGFLTEEMKGEYPKNLRKEYRFLQQKYQLQPLDSTLWKFMRMRPVNFPTIRIAQLAALIHKQNKLFSKLLSAESIHELRKLFDVTASAYWDSHYRLDVPASDKRKKAIGKSSIEGLLINVVVPLFFSYAQKTADQALKGRLLGYLEAIAPEKNRIVKKWQELGVEPQSAYDTQALIQLKQNHCDLKKCLTCIIGNSILKQA